MPILGRRLRVVRPDIRGFGRSTPMVEDYAYSLDGLIDDFLRLMDHLGIERFHLVAAKVTASAALLFAASQPRRVLTLTVISAADSVKKVNVSGRGAGGKGFTETSAEIDRLGIEAWARQTMPLRMGSDCPPEMLEGLGAVHGADRPFDPKELPARHVVGKTWMQPRFFRRLRAPRWSSPPTAARWARRSPRCAPGKSASRTPSWWCCPAIRSTSRRRSPRSVRAPPSTSSNARG